MNRKLIFIDGTKIEANANKFTFVWKKCQLKNTTKSLEIIEIIESTLQRTVRERNLSLKLNGEKNEELSLEELSQMASRGRRCHYQI